MNIYEREVKILTGQHVLANWLTKSDENTCVQYMNANEFFLPTKRRQQIVCSCFHMGRQTCFTFFYFFSHWVSGEFTQKILLIQTLIKYSICHKPNTHGFCHIEKYQLCIMPLRFQNISSFEMVNTARRGHSSVNMAKTWFHLNIHIHIYGPELRLLKYTKYKTQQGVVLQENNQPQVGVMQPRYEAECFLPKNANHF